MSRNLNLVFSFLFFFPLFCILIQIASKKLALEKYFQPCIWIPLKLNRKMYFIRSRKQSIFGKNERKRLTFKNWFTLMVIEFKFNFFSRSVLSYSSVTIYNRENKHVIKTEREREKRTTRKSLAHSPPATVAKCNAANEARDIREPRQHAVVNRSFPRKRWLHLWKSRENARKKFERFVVQLASWITMI